ncbi:MAG: hypothetical protein F6K50_11030 [Moorea sp. SIO3I7]|nr:hypothetical protein [Moorena sp. SIO3I7]
MAIPNQKFAQLYSQEKTLKATPLGNSYAGFALEVGEEESHGNYEDFKQAVKTKSQLDLREIAIGKVQWIGSTGESLKLTYNPKNDLPSLTRNGIKHDWSKHLDLYKPVNGNGPISLGWKIGNLRVDAGDLVFEN